jgi:enolase-phosphatase E1
METSDLTIEQFEPATVLFLSDNVKEVDAAIEAGMQSILVDRPGNAPVSDADRSRLHVVASLDEIKLQQDKSQS